MNMLNTVEQAVGDLERILAMDIFSWANADALAKRVEEYKTAITLRKAILRDERADILGKQASLGVDGGILPTSIGWNDLQKQLKTIDCELYG